MNRWIDLWIKKIVDIYLVRNTDRYMDRNTDWYVDIKSKVILYLVEHLLYVYAKCLDKDLSTILSGQDIVEK